MPWRNINTMDQKTEFVFKSLDSSICFTELCKEYGISTTCGYKWKKRFFEQGISGLNNKSRKPKSNPNQTTENTVCEIIKIKNAHRRWGAKKIRAIYKSNHANEQIPSLSTFNRILDKSGLVEHKKKRKQRQGERIQTVSQAKNVNDIWTVDFKGWWYTSENEKCNPLTIRDQYSKYILAIKIMKKGDSAEVKAVFENLFIKYGLPKVIRSDNGPPFASAGGLLGLTKLSVWWLSLGIQLDRISPGKPYENGSHERMHRDIKFELQGQIQGGLRKHQAVFDVWRKEYNEERPHESLDMKTPSAVYKKSKTIFKGSSDEIIYPIGYISCKVCNKGNIGFRKRRFFISTVFHGYNIGLKEANFNKFGVWFDNLRIGEIDYETQSFKSVNKIVVDKKE